jgi:hypothetical protein
MKVSDLLHTPGSEDESVFENKIIHSDDIVIVEP